MAGRRSNLDLFENLLNLMNHIPGGQKVWRSFLYHFQRTLLSDPQRFIDLVTDGGFFRGNLTVDDLVEFFGGSEFVGVDPRGNLIVRFQGFDSPDPSENGNSEDENVDINIIHHQQQHHQEPIGNGQLVLVGRSLIQPSHQPSHWSSVTSSAIVGASTLTATNTAAAAAVSSSSLAALASAPPSTSAAALITNTSNLVANRTSTDALITTTTKDATAEENSIANRISTFAVIASATTDAAAGDNVVAPPSQDTSRVHVSASDTNENEPLPGRSDGGRPILPEFMSLPQKKALKRDKKIAMLLQNAIDNESIGTVSATAAIAANNDDESDYDDDYDEEANVTNMPAGPTSNDNDDLDELSDSDHSDILLGILFNGTCDPPSQPCSSSAERIAIFNNAFNFANDSDSKMLKYEQGKKKITKPLRKKDFVLRKSKQTKTKKIDNLGFTNKIKQIKKKNNKKTVIEKRVKRNGSFSIPVGGVMFSKTRYRKGLSPGRIIQPAACPPEESDTGSVVVLIRKKKLNRSQKLKSKAKPKNKQATSKIRCVLCDKDFTRIDSMKRHMEELHRGPDDPYYACSASGCQSVFKTKRTLNDHMILHRTNNIPLYPCPFCSEVFRTRNRLNHHIDKNHRKDFK